VFGRRRANGAALALPLRMQAPSLLAVPRPRSRSTLASVDLEVLEQDPPRHQTQPPPLPERARQRVLPAEAVDPILAALGDLSFFETAVEGASFGVVTAMRALPSLAGLALLRDEDSGGFLVVYARGPRAHAVVRSRVTEDDPLVGLAMVRGGPVALEYGSDCPPPSRHAGFGDPWTAMVAPIQLDDRCIGLLELVDPLQGRTPDESARQTLAAIASHLSTFLRGRPLTVASAFAPEQVGLED